MIEESLIESFGKGERRAFSKLISLAENKDPGMAQALSKVYSQGGRARVIGITGPPGAGKSSLTSFFIRFIRETGKKVCVVAVDPVSPFTGGALLGDRIRLVDHFNDEGVFIRSLSTRGKLGGLSLATRQVVHLADAFGFDYIVVETVGVGQSEVDVRKLADLSLVVLVPEWGDSVQTLKSGLLEIGDLFVVNKADREGADRLVAELRAMLQMAHKLDTPVLSSSTRDEASVRALYGEVNRYFEERAGEIGKRREATARETVYELLESVLLDHARVWVEKNVAEGEENPYKFVSEFLRQNPPERFFGSR